MLYTQHPKYLIDPLSDANRWLERERVSDIQICLLSFCPTIALYR